MGVYLLLLLAAFCVLVAVVVCLSRVSRTAPRHAGVWGAAGSIASALVGVWAVMPWLAQAAETAPVSWPMGLAGAAVIAAPGLISGVVIAAGRK